MKELMLDDMRSNRKEEYQSPFGLSVLFDRAGGQFTAAMSGYCYCICLLYTSPSPRDGLLSRMPSSA